MTNAVSIAQYGTNNPSWRNRIINGGMQVWQRGTSFSSPGNITYVADRWFLGIGGSSPASAAQVAGPTGFQYALQVTGAAGNTVTQINQRIEAANTYDLVGQAVTVQANIQVSSAQSVVWSLYYPSAKDNFGSLTLIATGTWSATTTAATFTATATNMPAQVANGLMLLISPANGGAFTSGTITVTGVQLEAGSVATPFERRDYGRELIMCQRYYQTYNPGGQGFPTFTTYVPNGDTRGGLTFPVTMRAAPTVTFSTTSWTCIGVGDAGAVVNVTPNITIQATTINGFAINVTNPSVFSPASGNVCSWGTNSNPTYYANAEL